MVEAFAVSVQSRSNAYPEPAVVCFDYIKALNSGGFLIPFGPYAEVGGLPR